MLLTKQLTVAIDFHSNFFHTIEVNGYRKLVTNIIEYVIFCTQQKKESHIGLEQLKGK